MAWVGQTIESTAGCEALVRQTVALDGRIAIRDAESDSFFMGEDVRRSTIQKPPFAAVSG